ncbi:MAG TPA: chemotaxis protein CheB, partial [Polyangiales bacterium]|nr:chemotaxis protein CheB [Polyangiales bacterium]
MNDESLDSQFQPTLQHPTLSVPESPLLVVGVGGSAGALESLRAFFSALNEFEDATGLVVMLALASEQGQVAALVEQVRGFSRFSVSELRSGERIKAEHVYVVP